MRMKNIIKKILKNLILLIKIYFILGKLILIETWKIILFNLKNKNNKIDTVYLTNQEIIELFKKNNIKIKPFDNDIRIDPKDVNKFLFLSIFIFILILYLIFILI
jgi:hypothetical protein